MRKKFNKKEKKKKRKKRKMEMNEMNEWNEMKWNEMNGVKRIGWLLTVYCWLLKKKFSKREYNIKKIVINNH